jgi:hypothetical protein
MKMFISTFVFHMIIAFTMNAMFHSNDDDVFDFENNERENNNDNYHDHDWFDENETIDANVQKFIDRVIDSHCEIKFDRHDVVRLSIIDKSIDDKTHSSIA